MDAWQRFNDYFLREPGSGVSLDVSRMDFDQAWLDEMKPQVQNALKEMDKLEKGEIANPDEGRMVGHYWLRDSDLAPSTEIQEFIEITIQSASEFAASVHSGEIVSQEGQRFRNLLVIGIGGSALGPQLVADALFSHDRPMNVWFFDNTDPDGFDRILGELKGRLGETLCVVISKSGGTPETRNGMLETKAAYKRAGLNFGRHAVAVTGRGSTLDEISIDEKWLARFYMADWIGGRTSVMSAVGLVPLCLLGVDCEKFLAGAENMDIHTREKNPLKNMAMLLALMWYRAGNGRGEKDMVVLPYKDALVLFSKYLQQLVMESLGKATSLSGKTVHQGIAVYGNKGSTDQHAYIQQLRDGLHNFFATFIEVRSPARLHEASIEVDEGVVSADYLQGFLRGTRQALAEGGRGSVLISLPELSAFSLGALIALFERVVGFYAVFVDVNAYHQPGVEAGKKAATRFLELLRSTEKQLRAEGKTVTAESLAGLLGTEAPESIYHCLTHLAATRPDIRHLPGETPAADQFAVGEE